MSAPPGESAPWKVASLASLKRDGRLHLPDLQRGFVWTAERVRAQLVEPAEEIALATDLPTFGAIPGFGATVDLTPPDDPDTAADNYTGYTNTKSSNLYLDRYHALPSDKHDHTYSCAFEYTECYPKYGTSQYIR